MRQASLAECVIRTCVGAPQLTLAEALTGTSHLHPHGYDANRLIRTVWGARFIRTRMGTTVAGTF